MDKNTNFVLLTVFHPIKKKHHKIQHIIHDKKHVVVGLMHTHHQHSPGKNDFDTINVKLLISFLWIDIEGNLY